MKYYHDTVPKKHKKNYLHGFDEFPFNWRLARATETYCVKCINDVNSMHGQKPEQPFVFVIQTGKHIYAKKGTNNGKCFVSLARSEDANVWTAWGRQTTTRKPRGWCP